MTIMKHESTKLLSYTFLSSYVRMALGLNYEGSLQLVIIEREVPAERIKIELSRKA